MNTYTIERVTLLPAYTESNRQKNRDSLAGPIGNKCVYAGKIDFDMIKPEVSSKLTMYQLNENEFLSSIEVFEDGSVNVFVRNENPFPVAFLKVRKVESFTRDPNEETYNLFCTVNPSNPLFPINIEGLPYDIRELSINEATDLASALVRALSHVAKGIDSLIEREELK